MGVSNFHDLFAHAGHNVEVVTYGRDEKTVNVAIECTDCNEVLVDFDRFPEEFEMPKKTYADWIVALYENKSLDELVMDFIQLAIADLTDDVDCSPSNILDRSKQMTYLADQLGERLTGVLKKVAIECAREVGYASGKSWKES